MKVTLLKKLGLENTATVLTDELSEMIGGGQSEDNIRFPLNLPFERQLSGYALIHVAQRNQYNKRVSQEDSLL
ncbi:MULTISPECIES: hypothetical protein [unclassified Pedobacter]|uniref:hypothetical protein n=1 Tax=unclassified Pedobacter TaxID=2628915 RepID=UPI0014226475|nr:MULTISPECIES: hypothetical protein [unclassified Pedobacter]NII84247.1 hypothetical protein [Pedobacter sp. SG908]NMN38838.1 hypothetical protein [Pedobacter sp. SG918]